MGTALRPRCHPSLWVGRKGRPGSGSRGRRAEPARGRERRQADMSVCKVFCGVDLSRASQASQTSPQNVTDREVPPWISLAERNASKQHVGRQSSSRTKPITSLEKSTCVVCLLRRSKHGGQNACEVHELTRVRENLRNRAIVGTVLDPCWRALSNF